MHKFTLTTLAKSASAAGLLLLIACTPKYDWREIRGTDAAFVAVLPAKPATRTRMVNLDGVEVSMTMTSAEVEGTTFAIGTAELGDPTQAQKALTSMKTAMVRNIGGTVKKENATSAGTHPARIDIEASGPTHLMLARFIAKDRRIYQLIVIGKEQSIPREQADTFFTSFKPA